jgi:hypothetical protein
MLAGDDAKLIIWNLTTGEKLQEISCVFHGPISASTWIQLGDGDQRFFVFGCADGTIHLYGSKDYKVNSVIFLLK